MSDLNKSKLVKLITELNCVNLTTDIETREKTFQSNVDKVLNEIPTSLETILKEPSTRSYIIELPSVTTHEWNFILANFHFLHLLDIELNKPELDLLSIQEIIQMKTSLKNLLIVGILKNLQSNLPHHVQLFNYIDVMYNYTVLKCTVFGFCHFIRSQNLRLLILPHCLQGLLAGLYQITACPLKKPSATPVDNFTMTKEIYEQLLKERQYFNEILTNLQVTIHPVIFLKESMALFQASAPVWFKKAISRTLTNTLKSQNGVRNIALSLLNGVEDDRAKTWKVLQVLTQLIVTFKSDEVDKQVLDLLETTRNNTNLLIFERLVVSCAKNADGQGFVEKILEPLKKFTNTAVNFKDNEDVTEELKQCVRLTYGIFIDITDLPSLDISPLKSLLGALFQFYKLTTNKTNFVSTNKELCEIIMKYFNDKTDEIYEIFDNFIFGLSSNFRNDIVVEVDRRITVKKSKVNVIYTTIESADFIVKLLKTELKIKFFGYLLNCVINKEKYFTEAENDSLASEEDFRNPILERLLVIHKLLSEFSEDKTVQKCLKNNPEEIISFFENVLTTDPKNPNVFTIIMILDNLLVGCKNLDKYQVLVPPLTKLMTINNDVEVQKYCAKILKILQGSSRIDEEIEDSDKSALDLALEDVQDPLLPTRGHGLMTLTKLLQNKDKKALERKQYILNLFQLHLKNEDSFIYLTAIQGLAALADIFPDTVLNILCEEYSDFNRKSHDDGHEIRIKLGEALVRITRAMGETAPKYKALLLNTFLQGAKDDDHLQRASSLSNLAEVCRVLGYKLGTIITEVLVCVHDVIATDKSAEARRAAVTVIRQLFVGLEHEMLSFLKDDILPIYRTLKEIYYHDNDDVMRLQAQLALEELNENMRTIVFSKPVLHFDKSFLQMLD